MSRVSQAKVYLLGGYLLGHLPIDRCQFGVSGLIIGVASISGKPLFLYREKGVEGEHLCGRSDSINKD